MEVSVLYSTLNKKHYFISFLRSSFSQKESCILMLASTPLRDVESFPEYNWLVPQLGEEKNPKKQKNTSSPPLVNKTKQFQN